MYGKWFPPDNQVTYPPRGSFAFGERGDGGVTGKHKSASNNKAISALILTTTSRSPDLVTTSTKNVSLMLTDVRHPSKQNDEACADSGAGMHVTPHVNLLQQQQRTSVRIKGFAGSNATPNVIGSLGTLKNVLGCPSATTTLVSVGACVEGTASCIAFYQDAAFKISGIRVWKDAQGIIQCRIGKNLQIEHFATRRGPTGIYKIPGGISYFSSKERKTTTFANIAEYVKSSKNTHKDI